MDPDAGRPTSDVGGTAAHGSAWSYIGVGCITVPIGFFGGGMIGVLVAKVVGGITECAPPEGLPACNTWEYLYTGALIGLVGLPLLSVLRLRAGRAKAGKHTEQ